MWNTKSDFPSNGLHTTKISLEQCTIAYKEQESCPIPNYLSFNILNGLCGRKINNLNTEENKYQLFYCTAEEEKHKCTDDNDAIHENSAETADCNKYKSLSSHRSKLNNGHLRYIRTQSRPVGQVYGQTSLLSRGHLCRSSSVSIASNFSVFHQQHQLNHKLFSCCSTRRSTPTPSNFFVDTSENLQGNSLRPTLSKAWLSDDREYRFGQISTLPLKSGSRSLDLHLNEFTSESTKQSGWPNERKCSNLFCLTTPAVLIDAVSKCREVTAEDPTSRSADEHCKRKANVSVGAHKIKQSELREKSEEQEIVPNRLNSRIDIDLNNEFDQELDRKLSKKIHSFRQASVGSSDREHYGTTIDDIHICSSYRRDKSGCCEGHLMIESGSGPMSSTSFKSPQKISIQNQYPNTVSVNRLPKSNSTSCFVLPLPPTAPLPRGVVEDSTVENIEIHSNSRNIVIKSRTENNNKNSAVVQTQINLYRTPSNIIYNNSNNCFSSLFDLGLNNNSFETATMVGTQNLSHSSSSRQQHAGPFTEMDAMEPITVCKKISSPAQQVQSQNQTDSSANQNSSYCQTEMFIDRKLLHTKAPPSLSSSASSTQGSGAAQELNKYVLVNPSNLEECGKTSKSIQASSLPNVRSILPKSEEDSTSSLLEDFPLSTLHAPSVESLTLVTDHQQHQSHNNQKLTTINDDKFSCSFHEQIIMSGQQKSALQDKPKALVVSPQQVMILYVHKLTPYERTEILAYPHIYFIGANAKKRPGIYGPNNSDYDNEQGAYIHIPHDHVAYRYEMLKIIGKGSFGQVIKAYDHKTHEHVALKIVRNEKRFHRQAQEEIRILHHLRRQDKYNSMNIIHMYDYFTFRNHTCITFELLSINLYELIKKNGFKGFSLQLVRKFAHSLLQCLDALYKNEIIHCDMKPENVLLKQQGRSGIKVIDFGSSCFESQRVYTYIQSRFYRAPEVILGAKYGRAIDMWSLGCILAELLSGHALFPGENESDQLACIIEVLGMPSKTLLANSKRSKTFFSPKGYPRYCTVRTMSDGMVVLIGGQSRRGKPRGPPCSKSLSKALDGCKDPLFLNFIRGCLEWDTEKRLTPSEALKHPWLRRRLPRPPSSTSGGSIGGVSGQIAVATGGSISGEQSPITGTHTSYGISHASDRETSNHCSGTISGRINYVASIPGISASLPSKCSSTESPTSTASNMETGKIPGAVDLLADIINKTSIKCSPSSSTAQAVTDVMLQSNTLPIVSSRYPSSASYGHVSEGMASVSMIINGTLKSNTMSLTDSIANSNSFPDAADATTSTSTAMSSGLSGNSRHGIVNLPVSQHGFIDMNCYKAYSANDGKSMSSKHSYSTSQE
ncbi:smi35A [Drosophila busckii]|uniref:dual-specificity kinase n=1 Tax=Drosophila busckii TaxID=30019 RepID=A0A0M3QYS0_DROBS|nr:smi35A [Drosophila busckii]